MRSLRRSPSASCVARRCGPPPPAVLPLLVRGSSAIRDTIAALVWSTALLAATPYFDAGLSAGAVLPQPRGAVLGAIAGAAVAVAGGALRGPVSVRHP